MNKRDGLFQWMSCGMVVCILSLGAVAGVAAPSPAVTWTYAAQSNLYAPPLVAEVHPAPGLETILSDSEARRLLCVDAKGALLWSFDGAWKKRLIAAAALSPAQPDGARLLAVGNADGSLVCVDAASGQERWRVPEAGPVEWGGALWSDLNGDGVQELVLATLKEGVAAFDAAGRELWRHKDGENGPAVEIPHAPAACDIDGDGNAEVFVATRWGVLCLNGDGARRWERLAGDDFTASVTIADTDHNGAPELYTMSRNDHYLWRLDAHSGAVVWKRALAAGADTYNAAAIAAGDMNNDGLDELLAADALGRVYAVDAASGEIRWIFATQTAVHAAVSLGDVDGDGHIEILAASGDHNLYCLDATGRERWRFETGLRLLFPATITDVDQDGKTDILLCGSDRTLRCLTLGGRYDALKMPWPSRRFDAAQTGAPFKKGDLAKPAPALVSRAILEYGDFEQGLVRDGLEQFPEGNPLRDELLKRPRGWRMENTAENAQLAESAARTGKRGAHINVSGVLLSDYMPVESALRFVTAAVYGHGPGSSAAALRWLGDNGILREDPLGTITSVDGGWRCFSIGKTAPPNGARWVAMALHNTRGGSDWDDASLAGEFSEAASAAVLVNQAGYDVGAPKHFVVQASLAAAEAKFALLSEDGATAFEGALAAPERITGAFGQDWGNYYYKGDFSGFDTPGRYRIQATLDGVRAVSWPVEVGPRQIWQASARPAYRFFYYQRCGCEVPGFHGPCHLDDAIGPEKQQLAVAGGWHDAGDYNKYQNAPYVYGLARAYGWDRPAFDVTATGPDQGFLDEILWGGAHVRRMIAADGSAVGGITSGYGFWGPPELETDNLPGTGDERPVPKAGGENADDHQAGLARIAALLKERGDTDINAWTEPATRSLDQAMGQGRRGWPQLSAAVDLFRATGEDRFAILAKTLLEELKAGADTDWSAMTVDVVRQYDRAFGADHGDVIKQGLTAKVDALLALAKNPFGVYTFGPADKPNFFGTPGDKGGWHVGTNSHLFEGATLAALAYQYTQDPRYLAFIYDQFNWALGVNPFNLSLMEGVGSAFLPSYHNRIAFAGVARGAVPGSLVNGVTWRAVYDDRPQVDVSGVDIPAFESNECWLPHNTHYLNALAALDAAGAK